MGARLEAGFGDGEDALAELAQSLAPGRQGLEAELGYRVAELLALLQGPVLHLVPGGIERGLIVKQADSQGGERADAGPWAAVGAAHPPETLKPDFGNVGRAVLGPVGDARLFARTGREWG